MVSSHCWSKPHIHHCSPYLPHQHFTSNISTSTYYTHLIQQNVPQKVRCKHDDLQIGANILQHPHHCISAELQDLKKSAHPWILQGRWRRCGPCRQSWWTSACRSSSPHLQSGHTWGGSSGRWWGAGTPSACGDRWKDEEPEKITRCIIINIILCMPIAKLLSQTFTSTCRGNFNTTPLKFYK